jgi:hypothetical protein
MIYRPWLTTSRNEDHVVAWELSMQVLVVVYATTLGVSLFLNRGAVGSATVAVWNANLATAPLFFVVFQWLQDDTSIHTYMAYAVQLASIVPVGVFIVVKLRMQQICHEYGNWTQSNASTGTVHAAHFPF